MNDEKEILKNTSIESLEKTLNIIPKYFKETKYKNIVSEILQDAKRKSFNKKIFYRMVTTSYLAAYVEYKFIQAFNGNLKAFGWFSDRDTITIKYHSAYSLFYTINKNNFQYYIKSQLSYRYVFRTPMESKNYTFSLPAPQIFNDETLFYDSYNRIADYICATIADFDLNNKRVTKNKFIQMLENVIVDSNHNAIILYQNKISFLNIVYDENCKILSNKVNKINKIIERFSNKEIHKKRISLLKKTCQKYQDEYYKISTKFTKNSSTNSTTE